MCCFFRAPDLCRLLNMWSDGLYGEVNETLLKDRGMRLILEDTDVGLLEDVSHGRVGGGRGGTATEGEGAAHLKEMTKEMTRESWEVSGWGG